MKYDFLNFNLQEAEGQQSMGSADDISRLTAPEGSYEDDVVDDDTDTQDKGDDAVETRKTVETDTPATFTPSKDWELVKDLEGFEMPKDITAENEKELLKPFIAKKYGIEQPVLHPLAQQIQERAASNPNLSLNDLITEASAQFVDPTKMSTDEKIAFDMYAKYGEYNAESNPDGVTQEDIDEYIKGLSKIQKNEFAKAIEQSINAYNQKVMEDNKLAQQAAYEKQYEGMVENINKYITKLEQDVSSIDNVFGIPVNQEDHKVYLEEFKRLSIPDKATGLRGIDEILSNDVTLYKMYLLATKFGEEKVIEQITKGRESGKAELLKKLKITPVIKGSRERDNGITDFASELEALRRPAQ